MKNPKLIVKPFAKNGQKNVIPENYETSMDSNQATWDQGFGQITMLPVAAGGLPPKGQDFNGVLNQISENIVYLSQGGHFKFSPEYAESIGGYPKGAILQSDDEKKEYQSLIDNNKVNFNTASNISASWELVGAKYAIKTEVDLALLKKFDKANISGVKGNDNDKVPSLNLFTTETGKLATKGELADGLASKQPVGSYVTTQVFNDGLSKKFDKDKISQAMGESREHVMSQLASTTVLLSKFDKSGGDINGPLTVNDSTIKVSGMGDYTSLNLRRKSSAGVTIQTTPSSNKSMLTIVNKGENGEDLGFVYIPNLFGTVALLEYMTNDFVPVGSSILWNNDVPPPNNYWKNEGRSFSATEYPEAAKIFPNLRLPDDRGYALRIADNGRGIDPGRVVGTYQDDAIQAFKGEVDGVGQSMSLDPGTGIIRTSGSSTAAAAGGSQTYAPRKITIDPSLSVRTSSETRMKNVSKILITRMK
ncbi:hypothetical protein AB7X11_11210 [Providencia alcalifaciens]